MSDREHGYVHRCDERATEQYASLLHIVRGIVASKGWKVQAVNFIAGTKFMNQKAWNKSMEMIGVSKQKWDGTREKFIRVLLDEHENILNSYRRRGVDRGGSAGMSRKLGRVSGLCF